MPVLFIYLIKANIALVLFYLAYRFGLRRLTFYMLNRIFLLVGIAFSAIFPLVNINDLFRNHRQLAESVIYYAPDWHSLQQHMQPEFFTVWNLALYIFWTGVAVMTVRLLVQLLSLLRIHMRTTDGMVNKEKVKLMQDRINPFSFFKNIYINPSLHTEEELKDITAHEHIHVKGWHTMDIMTGELSNIFYWFNPGAWLMKIAIRENLEFITDRKILQSGTDAKEYQYSLIKVSSIPFAVPLVNHFNFSHLKQRIMMMNKERSARFHVLRYLLLLPVIAIVVMIVTSSQGQTTRMKDNMQKVVKMGRQSLLGTASPVLRLTTEKGEVRKKDTVPVAKTHLRKGSSASDRFLIQNSSVKEVGLGGTSDREPSVLIVWLKSGSRETYDINNAKEKKAAEMKYGKRQVEDLFVSGEKISTTQSINKLLSIISSNQSQEKVTTIQPIKPDTVFTSPGIKDTAYANHFQSQTVNPALYASAIHNKQLNKTFSTNPLYIVDDRIVVGNPLSGTLNPDNIKSISVVKVANAQTKNDINKIIIIDTKIPGKQYADSIRIDTILFKNSGSRSLRSGNEALTFAGSNPIVRKSSGSRSNKALTLGYPLATSRGDSAVSILADTIIMKLQKP